MLRAANLGEADRLVSIYTPDRGKMRVVARGARRLRSRLAPGIQPFTRSLFLCWRGRSLDGISQVQVLDGFRGLRESLEAMTAGAYACELIDVAAGEGDANPSLYNLLFSVLRLLDNRAGSRDARAGIDLAGDHVLLLAFQWQALALLGYRPRLEKCVSCSEPVKPAGGQVWFSLADGGVVCRDHAHNPRDWRQVPGPVIGILQGLLRMPLKAAPNLHLAPEQKNALTALTREFRTYVLERSLRSDRLWDLLQADAKT